MTKRLQNALILCRTSFDKARRISNTPHFVSLALRVSKRLWRHLELRSNTSFYLTKLVRSKFKHTVIFCLIMLLAAPASAATVGDSFTVGILLGDDSTPPSVPASVSAVPMSTAQIDVSWASSTDDTAVAGYQLFRDSIQIATTTLTSYSDTGLTASTTYTYTVTAFDVFNNFSSSSAPVSTTTFDVPAPPPTATSSPGGGNQVTRVPTPELVSFSVVSGTESAVLSFATDLPVRFSVRYGEGSSFNDGIIEGALFAAKHETLLSGLSPGTSYEFELTGVDRFGRSVVLKRGSFTTLDLPDEAPPPNVPNFTARVSGNDVLLSWDHPVDPDFAYVRIVRSHLFFPADPNDGIVVYEGRADEFLDRGALVSNGTQHYSIFAYDTGGNRSSGAIALAHRLGETPQTPVVATSTASSAIAVRLSDIEILQAGKSWSLSETEFELQNDKPFVIRVPYDLFPRHLKVITVTLALPEAPNRVFSFLLRANDDFTYYEAALAPLTAAGKYGLSFSVFDVNTNHIFELTGSLVVKAERGLGDPEGTQVADAKTPYWLIFLILLGLFVLAWWLISKRRAEDENTSVN